MHVRSALKIMLTGSRVFAKEEVISTSPLERYYSLYPGNQNVTIVDAIDNRARKVVHCDFNWKSNEEIFQQGVLPLLNSITAPNQSLQATVVVDGLLPSRKNVLCGTSGLVHRSIRYLLSLDVVESVYLGLVSLENNNRLRDNLDELPESSGQEEPVVMEDTKDCFTSVEDTTYVNCSEGSGDGMVRHLHEMLLATKHQVLSFIVIFKDSERMPNTTVQFLSLVVEEVARGMKSTRHCISSAASLIECRSPALSFTGTKFSFLLKPALLGQQPGLWISCYSPVSPTEPSERESFKEAFCVAQLASRVSSSRVGGSDARIRWASGSQIFHPSGVDSNFLLGDDLAGDVNDPLGTSVPTSPDRKLLLSPFKNSPRSANRSTNRRQNVRILEGEEVAINAAKPSIDRERSESLAKGLRQQMSESRAAQIDDLPSPPQRVTASPSDIRMSQEEPSRSSHEDLQSYKRMMDSAFTKLRLDMRNYISELEQTKGELLTQKSVEESTLEENIMLRQQVDALLKDRDNLRVQLQSREMESTIRSSPDQSAVHAARSADLLEMINYHQQEIELHVANEKAYRDRILEMEAQLLKKEERLVAQEATIASLREVNLKHLHSSQLENNAPWQEEVQEMKKQFQEFKAYASAQEEEVKALKEALLQERKEKRVLEKDLKQSAQVAEEMMQRLKNQYEKKLHQARIGGNTFSMNVNSSRAHSSHLRSSPESQSFSMQSRSPTRQISKKGVRSPDSLATSSPEPDFHLSRKEDSTDPLYSLNAFKTRTDPDRTAPTPSEGFPVRKTKRGTRAQRSKSFEDFMSTEPNYKLRHSLERK